MPDGTVRLRVWRTASARRESPGFDLLDVPIVPDRDMVLDVIERAWALADRTLVFRHACHHGSCGTCAVRVNGREQLPCVTPLAEVLGGRSTLTIEPVRNVPVLADLAVDPAPQIRRIDRFGLPYVRRVEAEVRECSGVADADVGAAERLEDCLECLACVSACPVASGDPRYLGPAALSAADRAIEAGAGDPASILALVDDDHGVWQCRSTWACTAVCPSSVGPAERIMRLRRRVLAS